MTPEDRQEAIDGLKEICVEIGCSGWSPRLCQNQPHRCEIIKKIVCPNGVELVDNKWVAKK
jgi:hypothetical protein